MSPARRRVKLGEGTTNLPRIVPAHE